jgi:epoxyqueuosine reductase
LLTNTWAVSGLPHRGPYSTDMKSPVNDKKNLSDSIKTKAKELGFTTCGIARAEPVSEIQQNRFNSWIAEGYHGQMHYMTNHFQKRMDPAKLVEGARSVICLALNYHQKNHQHHHSLYRISQYAAGVDYHYVIKDKLSKLVEFIREQHPVENYRIFTDSAPVYERYWAIRAGLGWTGKNACLIIPGAGSYFFLAEVILDLELEYDQPFEKNHCGNCTRCLDACPTRAITAPGVIDARRCISYLTIEKKDDIPEEFHQSLCGNIFGCDICQEVCPFNVRFSSQTEEEAFKPLPAIKEWTKTEWETMDKTLFKGSFIRKHSPLSRAGFAKIANNIRFAGK